MNRPIWPDGFIALCIVALAVMGGLALWGERIAGLLAGENSPAPPGAPSQIGRNRL